MKSVGKNFVFLSLSFLPASSFCFLLLVSYDEKEIKIKGQATFEEGQLQKGVSSSAARLTTTSRIAREVGCKIVPELDFFGVELVGLGVELGLDACRGHQTMS